MIELPQEETERRWRITTPQWPIMHAVLYGVTRDQLMARHKSNHVQVAYAPDAEGANLALAAKAAMFREMGLDVSLCGPGTGCSAPIDAPRKGLALHSVKLDFECFACLRARRSSCICHWLGPRDPLHLPESSRQRDFHRGPRIVCNVAVRG